MTTARNAAQHLAQLRERRPLVHNITNYVAMDVSANGLLALGASPAMIHAVEEVEEFVLLSDALVLNIGTLSPPWVEAMQRASARARAANKPIVLDPVGAGATLYRTAVAERLLREGVTVLRANASEVLALGGLLEGRTRGVDATHPVRDAVDAAIGLAQSFRCIVAVTGPIDQVTDGEKVLQIPGGSPLMAQVTALGCTASAAVAAFLGSAEPDTPPLASCCHALACFGLAGANAASGAQGPGTFRARFLDALANLSPEEVESDGEIRA